MMHMDLLGTVAIHRNGPITIHSYMSPADGEMVNSHVIETENAVVVIDAQLLRSYAQELRQYVDQLGKPIDRVIISHNHPDHWFGLEYFTDVPIYALPETTRQIDQTGDMLLAWKREQLRDTIAANKVVPTHTVEEGTETIDGLEYRFRMIVDGEAPFALLIELPTLKAVIAQDLVYNQIYPCVGEKNASGEELFDGWMSNLRALESGGYELVLCGHGEPTGPAIFEEMIGAVAAAKKAFESGIGPEGLKATMLNKYPHYRVPEVLDFANVFLYFRTW
jgi:glyoxylase-like metal-dependent hydrolase (beta-lactamase superfamily II)